MPVKEARPTMYRGTLMRSRLEADYAAELDRRGLRWLYEPICFASDEGQWLPDFKVTRPDGRPDVYVEVKPADLVSELVAAPGAPAVHEDPAVLAIITPLVQRMRIAWASEPSAALHLSFWRYGGGPAALRVLGRPDQAWLVMATYLP